MLSSTEFTDEIYKDTIDNKVFKETSMSDFYLQIQPIINIDKDTQYPKHLYHGICTVQFSQTMFDRDEQHRQILKMISEFPSIRRIVLFHDYSDKQKGLSKDHYHGFFITTSFGPLFRKYGNRKGRAWNDGDLRMWCRKARPEDTPHLHHGYDIYIRKYYKIAF